MADTPLRADSAQCNVTRLPSAPKRMVKQNHNQAARAARAALPKFPGEFIFPSIRKAMPVAKALIEMRSALTPEMELLAAICAALDETTRMKAVEALAPGVAVGRATAVQAFALLSTSRMTVGESCDLDAAIRRLVEC